MLRDILNLLNKDNLQAQALAAAGDPGDLLERLRELIAAVEATSADHSYESPRAS